jgi:hypothetical protein
VERKAIEGGCCEEGKEENKTEKYMERMGDAVGIIFRGLGELVDASSRVLASEGMCDRVCGAACTVFIPILLDRWADLREQIS